MCTDFGMQVELLYYGRTVLKVTTTGPEGCFIMQGRVPLGSERIYGPCSAQQISFPTPVSLSLPPAMTEAMDRLLCHLERGVLIWVAPDGMFIKRFCRGRVYWSGPMAQCTNQPNKLEREKTFKLLDIPTFLSGKAARTYLKRCKTHLIEHIDKKVMWFSNLTWFFLTFGNINLTQITSLLNGKMWHICIIKLVIPWYVFYAQISRAIYQGKPWSRLMRLSSALERSIQTPRYRKPRSWSWQR